MDDASKARQHVHRLDRERRKLLSLVLRPGKMVLGSLYEMGRRCGNPNCKCARGDKHLSWYLSRKVEGRTRLTYVGKTAPAWLADRVKRYQRHQKRLAEIRKIDREISNTLNRLRDAMVEPVEEVKKEHR